VVAGARVPVWAAPEWLPVCSGECGVDGEGSDHVCEVGGVDEAGHVGGLEHLAGAAVCPVWAGGKHDRFELSALAVCEPMHSFFLDSFFAGVT
jgi:hypothetical protein